MPNTSSPLANRLAFTAKQQVLLEPFEIGSPGDDEVLIEIHISLMSTGTENIIYNRLFESGSHWDQWVKYPFYPGYTSVGKVVAVGHAVTHLRKGDRVACRAGHTSHSIVKAATCCVIPPDLEFDQAVWFALAKIGYHGALAANHHLGDRDRKSVV